MAESADDPALYWIEPQQRGILQLDRVHVPKRLARTIRQGVFDVRIDSDFEGVIDGCAASRAGRRTTWINHKIRGLYRDLFDAGYCHTIEAWSGDRLVGGLYGVALNGAFFGESMFSTARDASKVALVFLCARLIHGGFSLLDTQFVTEHLEAVRHGRDRAHRVPHAAGEGARPRGRIPRPPHRRQPPLGPRSPRAARDRRKLSHLLRRFRWRRWARGLTSGQRTRRVGTLSAARGGGVGNRNSAGSCGSGCAAPGTVPACAGACRCALARGCEQSVSHTSNTGCSTASRPGLSANIQPEKIFFCAPSSWTSWTSTKDVVLGGSVGARE